MKRYNENLEELALEMTQIDEQEYQKGNITLKELQQAYHRILQSLQQHMR